MRYKTTSLDAPISSMGQAPQVRRDGQKTLSTEDLLPAMAGRHEAEKALWQLLCERMDNGIA